MKVIFFENQEKKGWASVGSPDGQVILSPDMDVRLKAALEVAVVNNALVPTSVHSRPKQTAVVFAPSDRHPLKFLELLVADVAPLGYVGNIVDESVDEQLVALLECLPANHEARLQASAHMDAMSILEKTALIELLEEQFDIVSEQ